MLAGYVPAPPGFVTGPGLDPDSGLLGAFALARTALALPLD